MANAYVYLMASRKNGTLYIGVTKDLQRRHHEHVLGKGSRFVQKYGVMRLVWYQGYDVITNALQREKTMKKWPRQWKINLIEENNPDWKDLSVQLLDL